MTKPSNLGLYAVAAAILIVGALAFDVPLGSLAAFGLVLVCPLMMFLMMSGMHGHGAHGHGAHGRGPDDRWENEPADRHVDRGTRP
jgi:hypothetical protein